MWHQVIPCGALTEAQLFGAWRAPPFGEGTAEDAEAGWNVGVLMEALLTASKVIEILKYIYHLDKFTQNLDYTCGYNSRLINN